MKAQWLGLLLLGTSGCLGGGDECDRGATRCNAGNPESCEEYCSDLGCHDKWAVRTFCTAAQTCVSPGDTEPLCVESSTKDPRCADTEDATYCSGDRLVQCQHGYRALTRACGADQAGGAQLPGGPAATACIDLGSSAATCIPATATVAPLCAGASGPHCDQTTLVECIGGYAVSETACASCNVQTAPVCSTCTPTARGTCHGYLGDGCALDEDCAAGMVCHDSGNGQRLCSLPCTIEGATSADVASLPANARSAQCYAAFAPAGLPTSTYSEVIPSGVLSCIAGFCKWAQR